MLISSALKFSVGNSIGTITAIWLPRLFFAPGALFTLDIHQ